MTRERKRDTHAHAGSDGSYHGYLERLRADLAELERALGEVQRRPDNLHDDVHDYIAYERQFRAFTQQKAAFASLLRECDHMHQDAAWAELKIRLDLAWRELLQTADKVSGKSR